MAQTDTGPGSTSGQATQLTLRVWHPDCWTLRSTARVDAGLVIHGVYLTGDIASARLTAYADACDDVEELIASVEASELTDGLKRIHEQFADDRDHTAAGNATEELLVEYRSDNSIHDAFVSRGFVPDDAIRIHGGEEYWTVISTEDRAEIRRRLDEVRREMDAEIAVERMTAPSVGTGGDTARTPLSERQREVFKLAKRRGYYTWPRETSASDLADEMDVSKTTLLEHLRKAEAKLLGPSD